MVTENILFICKHNVFRSQVAKGFFNKLNKNKNHRAGSAGLIGAEKKDLIGEKIYMLEKRLAKKILGIKLEGSPRSITQGQLKNKVLIIIVADNVPTSIFKDEPFFKGKIRTWKIMDVEEKTSNKEKRISNSIEQIKIKVENLVKELK